MLIKTEIRDSAIFGKGLFAAEAVRKGTIVCFFTLGSTTITEEEYVEHVARGTPTVMRTGTRYIGRYFTWTDLPSNSHFFNHSFTPNVLCHCGICLALCDIAAGEELTLDYRHLIDTTDVGIYDDAETGQEIRGLTARQTLLETARQLIELIEAQPDWDGGGEKIRIKDEG